MPTYEYACKDCDHHFDVVQSFADDALTECPNCGGNLRKVFSAAGIIFKGSGWHIKDYADSSKRGGSGRDDGSDREDDGSRSDGSRSDDSRREDGSRSDGVGDTSSSDSSDKKTSSSRADSASKTGSDSKSSSSSSDAAKSA